MKKRLIPWLVLLLALVAISCKKKQDEPPKPEDALPPITNQGRNTYGCLINGKPMIANYVKGNSKPISSAIIYPYVTGSLVISFFLPEKNSEGLEQSFSFTAHEIQEGGTYTANNTEVSFGAFRSNLCKYESRTQGFYHKTIVKINTKRSNIVAGTFESTLKVPNCDTIKITHGRFDFDFQ